MYVYITQHVYIYIHKTLFTCKTSKHKVIRYIQAICVRFTFFPEIRSLNLIYDLCSEYCLLNAHNVKHKCDSLTK